MTTSKIWNLTLLHSFDLNMALQETQITQQAGLRSLWFPHETIQMFKMNGKHKSRPHDSSNAQKVSELT